MRLGSSEFQARSLERETTHKTDRIVRRGSSVHRPFRCPSNAICLRISRVSREIPVRWNVSIQGRLAISIYSSIWNFTTYVSGGQFRMVNTRRSSSNIAFSTLIIVEVPLLSFSAPMDPLATNACTIPAQTNTGATSEKIG